METSWQSKPCFAVDNFHVQTCYMPQLLPLLYPALVTWPFLCLSRSAEEARIVASEQPPSNIRRHSWPLSLPSLQSYSCAAADAPTETMLLAIKRPASNSRFSWP